VVQSGRKALRDKPLAHAGDGAGADTQGDDDVVIGSDQSWRGIGQQENTPMEEFPGGGLPNGDQALQASTLFGGQCHAILVHSRTPLLESSVAQFPSNRIYNWLSIEG
jgi:hypothetical protein